MKKLKLFVMSLCAMFVAVLGVNAGTPDEDFRACLSGEDATCTLSDNIVITSYIEINRDVTIDLAKHKITRSDGTGNMIFYIKDAANVVFDGEGTVEITNANADVMTVNGTSSVVIKSGTFKAPRFAILVQGDSENGNVVKLNNGKLVGGTAGISVAEDHALNLTVENGSIEGEFGIQALAQNTKHTVTINGGTISGEVQAVSIKGKGSTLDITNGTISGDKEAGITILGENVVANIKGGTIIGTNGFAISGHGSGTKNSTITISGESVIRSNTTTAIYHPQSGTLNVTGGNIEGKLGIVARGGKINVSGNANIKATGETNEEYVVGDAKVEGEGKVCKDPDFSGCVKLPGGVGILVDNTENYPDAENLKATVNGGHFDTAGAPVEAYKDVSEDATSLIEVKGGSFNKKVDSKYLNSEVGQSESGVVGKVSTITVDKAENVNVEVPTNAAEGEEVTINVTPDEGYVVKEVLVNGTAVTKNADGTYSFVMPNKEVTITVNTEVETKEVVVEEQAAGDKEVTLSKETDEVLKDSLANTKDEELKELLKNNDVTVELKATKMEKESLEKEEVAKFESVVKGANVTEFFDLSILVEAAGEEVHYLKELSKPITLTIDLPELPEVAKGYERKYYIIREHNGVYEKLNATLEDGKLSFATDKFSTYALAYIDEKVKNPNTVDNIVSVVATGLVSLVVIAGGIVLVRKNKFSN